MWVLWHSRQISIVFSGSGRAFWVDSGAALPASARICSKRARLDDPAYQMEPRIRPAVHRTDHVGRGELCWARRPRP